jgi:hypothetical protein
VALARRGDLEADPGRLTRARAFLVGLRYCRSPTFRSLTESAGDAGGLSCTGGRFRGRVDEGRRSSRSVIFDVDLVDRACLHAPLVPGPVVFPAKDHPVAEPPRVTAVPLRAAPMADRIMSSPFPVSVGATFPETATPGLRPPYPALGPL